MEESTDGQLWQGAYADGWHVHATSGGHYLYVSAAGERFSNKREALRAAGRVESGGREEGADGPSAERLPSTEAAQDAVIDYYKTLLHRRGISPYSGEMVLHWLKGADGAGAFLVKPKGGSEEMSWRPERVVVNDRQQSQQQMVWGRPAFSGWKCLMDLHTFALGRTLIEWGMDEETWREVKESGRLTLLRLATSGNQARATSQMNFFKMAAKKPAPAPTSSKPAPAPTSSKPSLQKLTGIESVASSSDPSEIASRELQLVLFTPAVRRDIYAFMLNPAAPGTRVAHPSAEATAASAVGHVPFEAVCLGKASGKAMAGVPAMDTFVFVDREVARSPPSGFVFNEKLTMHAIEHLGEPTRTAIAATRAFEHYLKAKASCWGVAEASRLSVEFLVTFGMEMTPRLDVNNRIRSGKLSEDDIRTLSLPPFSQFVDQGILQRFQGHAYARVQKWREDGRAHRHDTHRNPARMDTGGRMDDAVWWAQLAKMTAEEPIVDGKQPCSFHFIKGACTNANCAKHHNGPAGKYAPPPK